MNTRKFLILLKLYSCFEKLDCPLSCASNLFACSWGNCSLHWHAPCHAGCFKFQVLWVTKLIAKLRRSLNKPVHYAAFKLLPTLLYLCFTLLWFNNNNITDNNINLYLTIHFYWARSTNSLCLLHLAIIVANLMWNI